MAAKAELVGLNVKLVQPSGAQRIFERVPGIVQVNHTFPEEDDPELATLYVIQVEARRAQSALQALRASSTVEYAEACAPRKLISA